MRAPTPIDGGYDHGNLVGFVDAGGLGAFVSPSSPLPVTTYSARAASSVALTGAIDADGLVGPFTPDLGRPIWIKLWGVWTGNVALLSSVDGGATKLPVTHNGAALAFPNNINEPTWTVESCAGALWFAAITIQSGLLHYWIGQ